MALKAATQYKWALDVSELTLEADTGESLLVKDIFAGSVSGGYLSLYIDNASVGYIRNDLHDLGSHARFVLPDVPIQTLLGYLWNKGIFKGFPVEEGQKFTVKSTGTINICIEYDKYDAGDQTKDKENGSHASTRMLFNYGRVAKGDGVLEDGDNLYEYSILPAEFPDFPFGKDVPAKRKVNIYGVCASTVGFTSGSGSNKQATQYIKMFKEETVLFDKDRRGLLLLGTAPSTDGSSIGFGYSVVGGYSQIDPKLPLMFDIPLTFESGEELGVIMNTKVVAGSANISYELGEICLIEKIEKVG